MVTHPAYPLPLLPHSLYHRILMHPAAQDCCTLTHRYLCRPVNRTKFPLHLLQSPLFPLFVHLCMAPVWLLLATTPVVWTAEEPKEVQHWVNIAPPLYPLAQPHHTCVLILCTLM